MDLKFIYTQLTKNSILKNGRIALFFSQNIIRSRRGTDLAIIALPFLVPVFFIIKKNVHDETAIGISILSAILILFLLAYFLIKKNKKTVLDLYPDIHSLLDEHRSEFFVIWGLFMLLSTLFNVAWFLFLAYCVF